MVKSDTVAPLDSATVRIEPQPPKGSSCEEIRLQTELPTVTNRDTNGARHRAQVQFQAAVLASRLKP